MMRRANGFTMVELVMVIIMLGILAVFVMPRMDTSAYRVLEFHDKTVAALRYAQKTATSHRRMVCVAFASSRVTLTIDQAKTSAACSAQLLLPGGNLNYVESTNVSFISFPSSLFIQPDGRITTAIDGTIAYTGSLTFDGQPPISVVGATGYVQ